MKTYLSKSKYCKAKQCNKILWLEKYKPEEIISKADESELDYHNLPLVHNGGEAMNVFANLAEKSKEEQEEIRKGLLVYCKLDTYAMVKIWEKLKEEIKE